VAVQEQLPEHLETPSTEGHVARINGKFLYLACLPFATFPFLQGVWIMTHLRWFLLLAFSFPGQRQRSLLLQRSEEY